MLSLPRRYCLRSIVVATRPPRVRNQPQLPLSHSSSSARRPAACTASRANSTSSTTAADNTMSTATPSSRGAFVVFEGLDRCGKTTQSGRLMALLQSRGVAAELWRFPERDPSRSATGPLIDAYLKKKPVVVEEGGGGKENSGEADTGGSKARATTATPACLMDDAAAHLLFSANRWERRPDLLAALRSGTTVVADRYAHSGVAYSAAKRRVGMDREWCAAPDAGLPAPDVVVFLDAGGGGAAGGLSDREGYGEERYEVPAFQAEVARQFEALLFGGGGAGGAGGAVSAGSGVRCVRVDARGTIDEVAAAVAAALEPALEAARAGAPVRRLWDGEVLPLEEE